MPRYELLHPGDRIASPEDPDTVWVVLDADEDSVTCAHLDTLGLVPEPLVAIFSNAGDQAEWVHGSWEPSSYAAPDTVVSFGSEKNYPPSAVFG